MVSMYLKIKMLAESGRASDEAGAKESLAKILIIADTALDTQKDWKKKNG